MSKKRREIPQFDLPMIETHFHLDYLKEGSAHEILEQARAVGVERFMTIAVAPDNLMKVLALADEHEDVYATLGIHPHEADHFNNEVEAIIRQHCVGDKVVAIGEIGLDYYYEHSDRAAQQHAFKQQLQIAIDHQMPVVIHTREADEDTIAILSEYAPKMAHKGVIHSFTSGAELAKLAVELGFCLGINGIVTFNKADNVRDIVAQTPLSSLLLETDAPFLTPVPYRGAENAPKFLPFVAEKIAQVKQISVEEVIQQTYHNAQRTFFERT
ncbi:MAG: TatD family hydrolase [Oleibacter sp.]|nr:TatD family hydrolase [Thalassolituus sp.]